MNRFECVRPDLGIIRIEQELTLADAKTIFDGVEDFSRGEPMFMLAFIPGELVMTYRVRQYALERYKRLRVLESAIVGAAIHTRALFQLANSGLRALRIRKTIVQFFANEAEARAFLGAAGCEGAKAPA